MGRALCHLLIILGISLLHGSGIHLADCTCNFGPNKLEAKKHFFILDLKHLFSLLDFDVSYEMSVLRSNDSSGFLGDITLFDKG